MSNKKYDVGILGGGVAGIVAALTAKRLGLSVVIFEKEDLGGACFNWGCLPSQEIISFARFYEKMKLMKEERIVEGVKEKFNWDRLKKKTFDSVKSTKGHVNDLLDKKGIELVYGEALVINPQQIQTVDGIYHVNDLVIATGGKYLLPSFVSSADKNFYTPRTFYQMKNLPKRLVIIGAGVLGVEYAITLSTLGVEVYLVESDKVLMSYLDVDLREKLLKELSRRGIQLCLDHKAVDFGSDGLVILKGSEKKTLKADAYLNAMRREGNIGELDKLIEQGLHIGHGHIKTDGRCRTSLKHVYAVGDVNGRILLAHVAAKEAETAVLDIAGQGEDIIYELTHYNMYSFPQFSSVGMTEQSALEAGFLTSVSKVRLDWQRDQFAKIVYDKVTEEVLGVHIFAENANDLIVEAVGMMEAGATVTAFLSLVRSHPIHSVEFAEKLIRG